MKEDDKRLTQKLIEVWDDFSKGKDSIIALFLIEGKIKSLKLSNNKSKVQLDRMIKDFTNETIGVYNKNAKFFDVMNDLKFTNSEYV